MDPPKMHPTFTLASSETGTEYWIYADLPREPGPWPVVLFMDGDDQFAAASAAIRAIPPGEIRPLLLIGVGYGASYAKPANRRGRDYTPVHHADEPLSGGADKFLHFLTTTLSAELARRYPVDPTIRGLAGHSLGSLLVLHGLFQPRPFFTDFLASAPSIWWAERAILRQAEALRARQPSLAGRLFLSVGANDSASMTGDLTRLEQQLTARPFAGLKFTVHRFAGRNHYNVLPEAMALGVRTLCADGDNMRK